MEDVVVAVAHGYSLPVEQWPSNHALLQGMAYAQDPRTKQEYLFVAKAESAKKGEIEDSYYHRHVLRDGKWVYLDTMIGRGFGHPQNYHVRISAAGNTWLWPSVEQYNKDNELVRVLPGRVQWKKGEVKAGDVELMETPDGSWSVINTTFVSPARIVLRRGLSTTEVYTEHDEQSLKEGKWLPLRQFTRKKLSGTFQTAGANAKSVMIFQGSTSSRHMVYRYDWSEKLVAQLDVKNIKAPTGPNTSSEPEGMSFFRGSWYFGKRYNSSARRQYELFKFTL